MMWLLEILIMFNQLISASTTEESTVTMIHASLLFSLVIQWLVKLYWLSVLVSLWSTRVFLSIHLLTGLPNMSPTPLVCLPVLWKDLKFLPLSWDSACCNEEDPSANWRMCFSVLQTKSFVYLCVFGFTSSSSPNLLTPSHLAGFRVINFFIRICQQSALLCQDN